MGRLALRRWDEVRVLARCQLEIDGDSIVVLPPDSRGRRVSLVGATYSVCDATRDRRFVRHLELEARGDTWHYITPPEDGAIAPRVAGLPSVPDDALVLEYWQWDALAEWLASGGQLGGRTVGDLARLARAATSNLAVRIGEFAAQLATMATCDLLGPMRGCSSPRQVLAPLFEAAKHWERADEALVAALAAIASGPVPAR